MAKAEYFVKKRDLSSSQLWMVYCHRVGSGEHFMADAIMAGVYMAKGIASGQRRFKSGRGQSAIAC